MSASPPTADITQRHSDVRKVPKAVVKACCHSHRKVQLRGDVLILALPPSGAPRELSYTIRETVSGGRIRMEGYANRVKAGEDLFWNYGDSALN